MLRRDFIKNLSFTGLPLLFSNNLLPGKNFTYSINSETWENILEYARWSPSVHNIQPWKVKIVSETEALIFLDTTKLLAVSDTNQAFMNITMAMFTECIKIAAENFGYSCAIQFYQPAEEKLRLFSSIKLIRKESSPLFDKELLKKRKTSRLTFSGKTADTNVLTQLDEISREHKVQFGHSADSVTVEKLLLLNTETLFVDIDDDAYRNELQKWIRTTDEEAHLTKDGLWNYCMGVSGRLMHNFFYHHNRYKSHFKRKIIAKKYMHSFKGTKDIVWFSGSFKNFNDWVECGTFLMRFWLTLTKNNCVMHPFGSLITHQSTHAQLPQILNHTNGENIWFVARIGQSDDAPRSLRKDLETILIS
jgi:hypothetical protein